MPITSRSLTAVILAAAAGCAGETSAPPAPATMLTIIAADSVLAAGATLPLQAVGHDASGRVVPVDTVLWSSLDTTTARVDAAGTVTGAGIGLVSIVARAGALLDTFRLRVRVPALALGAMHVRLTGGAAVPAGWNGYMRFDDLLAADTGETTLLAGSVHPSLDSSLVLYLPGQPATSVRTLAPYPLSGSWDRSAPIGFLEFRDPGSGAVTYFLGVGGALSITAVAFPPAPGLEPGEVRGTVTMTAVRLTGGPGGPVLAPDTVRAFAEFRAHLNHLLHPNVRLTLSGTGPVNGTPVFTFAQALDDGRGGILVWWDADLDGLPQGYRFEASHEFRLLGPRPGTFALSAITPDDWADPARWPGAFSSIGYRDDARHGFSTGGTLIISEYVPPTLSYYGRIVGTVSTALALWTDPTTVTADTVQATATFAVQLWPLGGVPAVPGAGGRVPGSPFRPGARPPDRAPALAFRGPTGYLGARAAAHWAQRPH